MQMKFMISSFILLAGFLLKTNAQDINGTWSGLIQVPQIELPLVLHVDEVDGKYQASVDSPKQEKFGIPVDTLTFENNKLRFVLLKLSSVYEGKIVQKDSIEGTFTQRGAAIPLNLGKVKD
uniref:Alpha/beta hydrolase n=1 Tax=Sphingobacterium sp. (strain 21) TaxID=743722 RepID=F4C9T0_SPHS2